MTICISKLNQLKNIDKIVIHSLDNSLYQASVIVDGQESYITDKDGKLLRGFNVLNFQALFTKLNTNVVMQHQSAYDEMIGQPLRTDSNAIEIPIGNAELAAEHPKSMKKDV